MRDEIMLSKTVRLKMKRLSAIILVIIVTVVIITSYVSATGKLVPNKIKKSYKSLAKQTAQKQTAQKLRLKLEEIKPKGLAVDPFRPWLQNDCKPIKKLLNQKDMAQKRIMQTVMKLQKNFAMSQDEKKYQIQAFRILSQVINMLMFVCLLVIQDVLIKLR